MKISNIISKQVLSLYEAENNLVIYKPVLSCDYKKIKGFVLFDIEEKEHFLPFNSIHNFSDLVVIKNLSYLKPYDELDEDFIGSKVFDTDGKDLGFLIDLEINNDGEIQSYITTKSEIKGKIHCMKNNLIFYGDKELPKNIKPKSSFSVKLNTSKKVSILNNEIVPTKQIANTSILIGRRVTQDVYANNAEVIAKKDQYINEKILVIAKKYNKLNQLFFSSI